MPIAFQPFYSFIVLLKKRATKSFVINNVHFVRSLKQYTAHNCIEKHILCMLGKKTSRHFWQHYCHQRYKEKCDWQRNRRKNESIIVYSRLETTISASPAAKPNAAQAIAVRS